MSKNARSNNNATRNTARPTAARNAQQVRKQPAKHSRKPQQPKMASSNKWMLIIGVGFLALRLIFPDLMAILGSSLTGLTILAVIAIVLAVAAYIYNLSVPDFIGSLFSGLVGAVNSRKPQKRQARRATSYYEEDEFEYDEEVVEPDEIRYADEYDDYDDYDDSPVVEAVVVEEEPPVPQMHRRRRPVEAVVVEEEPQTPSFAEAVRMQKPSVEVPEGYEWKLEGNKWAIRPMTPPDIDIPDGFEWKLDGGKWKVAPKA
ncbi:MAG: DUF4118 domain-containing protein [Clostridia bacterium]|nr:DUF4118 domain-containing protein [Clostridia bacterium]